MFQLKKREESEGNVIRLEFSTQDIFALAHGTLASMVKSSMNRSFSCCVLISNCSICTAANMNGKRNVLFSEFVAYFPFNCKFGKLLIIA